MIDFGHVVQDVQQLLIGRAAYGQGFAYGDHALTMTTQRRHALIQLPNVPTDCVGQIARGVAKFTADV